MNEFYVSLSVHCFCLAAMPFVQYIISSRQHMLATPNIILVVHRRNNRMEGGKWFQQKETARVIQE
uniref:Uncharacterized protein n=1 Tax=Arundo donax TaxID=35708 RepID=A0A0A9BS54_ARUDO